MASLPRFLETTDEYFDYYPEHKPRKGFWKIYGLGLSKEVLEKIYFKNAEQLLSPRTALP
jgi:predicted TIM-barrel fold metal-dependent hydrolase